MTNEKRLPTWFVIAAFFVGNGFVFVNPPLRAPDEWAHFARAYQVSHFQWLPEKQNGILGGNTPAGIENLNNRFVKATFEGVTLRQIQGSRSIPFNRQDTKFLFFPSIAEYPWLPFLPQAAGIDIARLFFNSTLAIMYCAREANLLAYIALSYLALRLMPQPLCRLTLALIGALPMSLHQAGSLSADAMTIAFALLAATAIWRLAFLEGPASRFDVSLVFLSTVCLSFTKLAYSPLSLLVLMIPAKRLGGPGKYAAFLAMLLLCNGLVIILWMRQFHGMPSVDLNPAVNPALQKQYILHHPGRIVPIVISTTKTYGKEIATGVIGAFGENEIMLPLKVVLLYYLLLLISVAANTPPRHWRAPLIALSTAALNLAAMLTAFYIECRPVAESAIDGFQGRYLIPLLPLLLFFGGDKTVVRPKLTRLLFIAAISIAAFSVLYLAQVFYPAFPTSRFYFRWSE